MNTGQMLLSIGGMLLVSLLYINVNKATGSRIIAIYSNEAVIEATAMAEAMFEDIQTKSFDEQTVSTVITDRTLLTSSNSLGAESGEIFITQFDDVDDYDQYTITDTINVMGDFSVNVTVSYIDGDDFDQTSANPTFLKQVTVTINNISLPSTLIFERFISY